MDGTIPRAKLPMVLRRMQEMSAQYDLRVANVFHAGDGNLHPLILYDANKPGELERAEAFGADILRLCVEVGGVLTGEHGVGVEKRDLMPVMFSESDLDQQQRLKCAFDENGLLNPGKVFPTLHRCAELGRMHVHGGRLPFPDHAAVLIRAPSGNDRYISNRAMPRTSSRPSMGARRRQGARGASAAAPSARSAGRRSGTPPSISPASPASPSTNPRSWCCRREAGTPLAEIEALVAASGQELAFEPMDYGPLLGVTPDGGTIGGAIAANLSGPRRIKAGAARDHFLGVSAVSGRGETFKSGGRVVKNVTGYDLCKLLAGSWGTLAVMTDVTIKMLPRAETEETILIFGLDDAAAGKAMAAAMALVRRCLGGRAPAGSARRADYRNRAAAGAVTAFRLEGVAPSVAQRRACAGKARGVFCRCGHTSVSARWMRRPRGRCGERSATLRPLRPTDRPASGRSGAFRPRRRAAPRSAACLPSGRRRRSSTTGPVA